MTKVETLKKNKEFKSVFDRGKSLADRNIVIYFSRNNNNTSPKIGLVVSKKFGNAVRRNRLKRVIKEVFRLNSCKLINEYDLIVIPRYNNNEIEFQPMEKSFLKLCSKAGIIQSSES